MSKILIELVSLGMKDDIVTLLGRGYDINEQNDSGTSVALAAVLRADEGMLQFLIDHGAKVNLIDDFGRTPLSCAQAKGYDGMTYLIQKTLDQKI